MPWRFSRAFEKQRVDGAVDRLELLRGTYYWIF
jgi:hypothetical protein